MVSGEGDHLATTDVPFGVTMTDTEIRSYRMTPRTLRLLSGLQFNLDMGPSEIINFSVDVLVSVLKGVSEYDQITMAKAFDKVRENMAAESYSQIINALFAYDNVKLTPFDEFIGMKD